MAEVKKPLISVKRIAEKGNQVCFGPGENDNFILNVETGDKVFLRNGRGSCLLDVTFASGKKAEITVDSGAEESVCPWDWGEEYGLSQSGQKMLSRWANGAWINHYGERKLNRIFVGGDPLNCP